MVTAYAGSCAIYGTPCAFDIRMPGTRRHIQTEDAEMKSHILLQLSVIFGLAASACSQNSSNTSSSQVVSHSNSNVDFYEYLASGQNSCAEIQDFWSYCSSAPFGGNAVGRLGEPVASCQAAASERAGAIDCRVGESGPAPVAVVHAPASGCDGLDFYECVAGGAQECGTISQLWSDCSAAPFGPWGSGSAGKLGEPVASCRAAVSARAKVMSCPI